MIIFDFQIYIVSMLPEAQPCGVTLDFVSIFTPQWLRAIITASNNIFNVWEWFLNVVVMICAVITAQPTWSRIIVMASNNRANSELLI